jgi:hypothetical protein
MLGHVALNEYGRHLGIQPNGEQHRCKFNRRLTDHPRLCGRRERMEIDDPVEHIFIVLSYNPISQCTEVIAEVN